MLNINMKNIIKIICIEKDIKFKLALFYRINSHISNLTNDFSISIEVFICIIEWCTHEILISLTILLLLTCWTQSNYLIMPLI